MSAVLLPFVANLTELFAIVVLDPAVIVNPFATCPFNVADASKSSYDKLYDDTVALDLTLANKVVAAVTAAGVYAVVNASSV